MAISSVIGLQHALNFAEFEAMIAPIAAVFIFYGGRFPPRRSRGRDLGGVLGRNFRFRRAGAFASAIVAFGFLSILWVERSADPRSLKSAIAAVSTSAGIAVVILAVLFVGQVPGRVLGGGADQASTDGRRIEWQLAMPKILANPVTGNGFGNAGFIVGYYSPRVSVPVGGQHRVVQRHQALHD